MAAPIEDLATGPLGPGDAAAGFALSAAAGWNQSAADWRLMLEHGHGIGQRTAAGELVASALVLPYGDRVAWIAMVLTAAAWRRRGLATANLAWALGRCRELGLVAGLDATPAGREVYHPLGFHDLLPLQRWVASWRGRGKAPPPRASIRPMTAADLDAVERLDGAVFGALRPHLIAYLWQQQPACAWVAEHGGRLAGLVLARSGRRALHLGPLIAAHPEEAAALLAGALSGHRGPVSLDVPDAQAAFTGWLASSGFTATRPFMRMLQSAAAGLGDAVRSFAIAGPEFG